MDNTSQNSHPRLTSQSKTARSELERALTLHFQGNKAGALKSLYKALKLDPALAGEPLTVADLAREVTGLAPADALKSVADIKGSKELIDTAQKEQQSTPQMRRQRMRLFVLAMLSLIFIAIFAWSLKDGSLRAFLVPQARVQQASLGGYDYYMTVPRGSAPEGGWPVVVVFHGYGGDGRQMLPLMDTFNNAGAIFLSPTLGTYEPNPGNGPLEPVSRILTEVGKQYPLKSRGAILLGLSQGGSFAYRFSVHYPGQVAGVVTAGAPELDPIFPSGNIPYIFTWGELDDLQQFVLPQAYSIQNRGFNVRTVIVPGVGHVLSQYAIDQALILLEQP